jgi:nucleotide-binding universal stress UspA family protein
MIIKNILVPVDFSPTSDAALAYARMVAETFQSTLHVLHVVPDPAGQPWAAEAFGVSGAAIREQWERDANTKLEALVPAAERADRVRLVIRAGVAVWQILEYAKEANVDLIVIGTHGRSPIAHALIGSVAERIVRKATCPVLTIRPPVRVTEPTAAAS